MIKEKLTLKVVLPDGLLCHTQCDSVNVCIVDDKNGKGAGSYGIRRGHAKAVLCLSSGKVEAFDGEKSVFSKQTSGGFADIENDVVSVVVDFVN